MKQKPSVGGDFGWLAAVVPGEVFLLILPLAGLFLLGRWLWKIRGGTPFWALLALLCEIMASLGGGTGWHLSAMGLSLAAFACWMASGERLGARR